MGLDSGNIIVHVEKVIPSNNVCGKGGEGRARKLAETQKLKAKEILIAMSLDAYDTRCFDPEVYTLVRKCYNMRVKLYHILNTIHKVVISRVSNGYDQIPRFKRNGAYYLSFYLD